MWICTNVGFISIVDKAPNPDDLVVRARRSGDLKKIFPDCKEVKTPGNDYLFRAFIPRSDVAKMIHDHILNIDYSNFKDSVDDDHLHNTYSSVWHVVGRLQPGGPYSRGNRQASVF